MNQIRILSPLLKFYPWVLPLIITLGVFSSLAEGFSISLFIPLLESSGNIGSQVFQNSFVLNNIEQIVIDLPREARILVIAFCIFIILLLKNLIVYINKSLVSWLYLKINHRLRSSVFNQLLKVSYSFLETNQSGKLLNTLTEQTWRSCEALSHFFNLIINVCTISVFVILLLLISWQLTLLVAAGLVLISLSIKLVTGSVNDRGKQAVQANSAVACLMLEGFSGMKIIRAFGHESYEQKRFDVASNHLSNTLLKIQLFAKVVNPLSEVLSTILLLCILVIALLHNQATLPTLLTFLFMLYRLQPQVKQLDSARVELAALTSAVEDVMYLLNPSDKPYIHSGNTPFKGLRQEISFESVTFHYNPSEKPALKTISIAIPQGKTIALVGSSGAGKSTIIDLIYRFYDPTEGEIYVDGCPLQQLDLADWRSRIALVSQEIHMFSTTVGENIAYGRLDATEDEIRAAAKLAHAHEFITQLPEGYDTKVGDRGIRLSGGQRQRIALARAIVRDPEILILDEATNALDSVSENLIQEALSNLSQNRTVIVIAHRLSTIEQADQILVLKQGQVIEQGKFKDLLKLNGFFTELYRLQNRYVHI
ncbi:ABC transporter ATP-binding protein [Moorena sp. SIO4G3]|uniref:ABC transporter ATP-binding protein n=1 Tax=Moorena sp. SIO4G3 TaxID=2607821 RepID=UPI00142D18B9|nr:ABC transporter ATP-binding protein [Moorena sp. SIO4G3]NEO77290.1 ABC transporter ATP-binding protein [Moorena sp. SIO4G3]